MALLAESFLRESRCTHMLWPLCVFLLYTDTRLEGLSGDLVSSAYRLMGLAFWGEGFPLKRGILWCLLPPRLTVSHEGWSPGSGTLTRGCCDSHGAWDVFWLGHGSQCSVPGRCGLLEQCSPAASGRLACATPAECHRAVEEPPVQSHEGGVSPTA